MDRCLIIILLSAYGTSGFDFPKDEDRYEGNNCTLTNGTIGICQKLPEFSSRMMDEKDSNRKSIRARPADIACAEYMIFEEIEKKRERRLHRRYKAAKSKVPYPHPYMVALGYENTDGKIDGTSYTCGGVLISLNYVLTAAHCVSNINNRVPVNVRLGNLDYWSDDTQIVDVRRIIVQPNYKRSENYNDIALIQLVGMAARRDEVKPICLQTRALQSPEMDPNPSIVAIGLGATNRDYVQTGNLSLVQRNVCSRSYNRSGRLPAGLADSMICAITTNRNRSSDACQDDNGGTFLFKGIGNALQRSNIIGVPSFGRSCGGSVPAVWTSIYSNLDWIEWKVWPEHFFN